MPKGSTGSLTQVMTQQIAIDKYGNSTVTQNTTRYSSDSRESWDGGSIAGFHRRKRAGELLPFNSYIKYCNNTYVHGCDWTVRYQTGSGSGSVNSLFYYTNQHPGVMPLISDADLNTVAASLDARPYIQAAAAKIAASGFDALTFIAEIHEIRSMFLGAGKTLSQLLRKGVDHNSWLQYRYGWRCLYFDLKGITEMINSLDSHKSRFLEHVDATQAVTEESVPITYNWQSSSGTWSYQNRITKGIRGLVAADITPPKIMINPVATAWELVKYSFVIDWFIQIGQWINAMTFLILEERHYAAGAIRVTYEREHRGPSSQTMKTGWSVVDQTWHQYHRRSILVRTPQFVPLGITTRLRLDSMKVIDVLAMVSQLLRR